MLAANSKRPRRGSWGKEEEEESLDPKLQAELTPSAADKAVHIHLITNKIVTYATLQDLLKLRMLGKKWKEVANVEIRKRNIMLNFSYDDRELAYKSVPNTPEGKSRPLSELADILSDKSTDFPCSRVMFVGGDLKTGGGREFFYNFGESIKTLILKEVIATEETLVSLLMCQAPNIEKLSFSLKAKVEPEDWNPKPRYFQRSPSEPKMKLPFTVKLEPLQLSSLKYLHFGESMQMQKWYSEIAKELVSRAPGLKFVGNFPLTRFFDPNFWKGEEKSYLFKEFTLNNSHAIKTHTSYNHLAEEGEQEPVLYALSQFADAKPRLKILRVDPGMVWLTGRLFRNHPKYSQLESELERIFMFSQDTLRKLEWGYLGSIPQFPYPNVEMVSVHINVEPYQQFNVDIFLEIFPRAKSLKLDSMMGRAPSLYVHYFRFDLLFFSSPGTVLPSVIELELSDDFTLDHWDKLIGLFPNLKILKCKCASLNSDQFFQLSPTLESIEWMTYTIKRNDKTNCVKTPIVEEEYIALKNEIERKKKWMDPELFSM